MAENWTMTARLVVHHHGFMRAASRLCGGGTSAGKKLWATARSLEHEDPLPGLEDYEAPIPPVEMAWVRHVPGTTLWLWYKFTDETVTLRALTTVPPER